MALLGGGVELCQPPSGKDRDGRGSSSAPAPPLHAPIPSLTEEERSWLREHPVIRVVQDPAWPPVEFADERGNPSGMTGDYLMLIEQRLGVRFERLRSLSWQESYGRLQRWDVDMTTSVAATPERTRFWAFTKPYMTIPIVIVTRMDVSYVDDMRALERRRVAVVDGYAASEWIPRDFPAIQLVKVRNVQAGLDLVQRGDVFALAENMLVVSYCMARQQSVDLKIAGQTPYVNAQSMAVRKDWAILAVILQKALDSISETERTQIYQSWLPIRYEHGFNYGRLWQALAAFAVLLTALLVWNRRLAREIRRRTSAEAALVKSEDSVRRSEERLRQAVEASRVGIFDHDHRTDVVYWSPEVRRIFGWTAEQNVGLPDLVGRMHPADRERVLAALGRAHDPAGDGVYHVEYRLQAGDSAVRWISARSQTFFEGEGDARRARRTIGALLELTERKRVEEELREATRVLLESQRGARLGSYRLDVVAGTWTSSPTLDELFGITDPAFPRDVSGWLSIVHPEERNELGSFLQKDVVGERQPFDREYRIVRLNDGQERWVHGRGRLLADEEGRIVEMIGTIQDITERKLAEVENARMERLLLQSQKIEAIGRLAGGVAHDFNNLLSVIRGHGERLLHELGEDVAARGRVSQIVWAADKGGSLTHQLLAFSRRQVLEPRVIRLDAVLADARQMLERIIGEDVELVIAMPERLGSVRADPGQMVQVLLNLAVNARDAMPRGGLLAVECADVELDETAAAQHSPMKAGRYVMMEVRDTGHGMNAETQQRIFEPFFTTKELGKGTGLGLATVYGIVKQSGGFVWVDSEVGVGTTFRVYLPCVDEVPEDLPSVAVAGATTVRTAPGSTRGRILLVEDDDGVRELMADVLGTAGYDVTAHGHPTGALEAARSSATPVDLLVTDVIMPGLSGRELARRLAAHQRGLRVLFVSGYGGDALARQGGIEPGEHFLQKPFSEQELLRIVAAAIAD